jgi:hypothetical protein
VSKRARIDVGVRRLDLRVVLSSWSGVYNFSTQPDLSVSLFDPIELVPAVASAAWADHEASHELSVEAELVVVLVIRVA